MPKLQRVPKIRGRLPVSCRDAVLSQQPPPEPCVYLSIDKDSPGGVRTFTSNNLLPCYSFSRSGVKQRHYAHLFPTWLKMLLPVLLCPANGLTVSLVGRDSHDYYQDSVTIGVATRRPSRVPYRRNFTV